MCCHKDIPGSTYFILVQVNIQSNPETFVPEPNLVVFVYEVSQTVMFPPLLMCGDAPSVLQSTLNVGMRSQKSLCDAVA